jgi:hypothetical protein
LRDFLKITPGVIRQIEAGNFEWNTNMIESIWDYYFSLPIRHDHLSRFNAKNKKGVLSSLIKIGVKRNKMLPRRKTLDQGANKKRGASPL